MATNFYSKLYSGANSAGQTVYSWLAASNITSFNANVAPLIHALWQKNFIPQSIYLGTFQFGTETFHATDNVTFSASDYYFNILQGTPITIAVSPAPQLGVSKSTLAVAMAFLMIALL
jgi:xyloglucan-specific endo-beta-1,4-glucanase